MKPGRPPVVEAASEGQALDIWAKQTGYADYKAAKARGQLKTAYRIEEPQGRPKAWRQTYEVWIRPKAGAPLGCFSEPNFWGGPRSENLAWARKAAEDANLPLIEVPAVNPDLSDPSFEPPGFYLVTTEFDELDPNETRVFRYR